MARFSDVQVSAIIGGGGGTSKFATHLFPGQPENGIRVSVRTLSESELDGCRVQAQIEIRKIAKARAWEASDIVDLDPEFHQRLVQRSVVARAFYDPDTIETEHPAPFFAGEEDVATLGSVEVARLFELYLEHQEWSNPRLDLTKDDVKELVERLGKEPKAEVALRMYGPDTLRSLCISLVHAARAT